MKKGRKLLDHLLSLLEVSGSSQSSWSVLSEQSVGGLECSRSTHGALMCCPHKSGGTRIGQPDGNCRKRFSYTLLLSLSSIP